MFHSQKGINKIYACNYHFFLCGDDAVGYFGLVFLSVFGICKFYHESGNYKVKKEI